MAEEKKLKFIIDLPEGGFGDIEFDKNKLNKVFRNLLSNAFKFTSEGFVKVKASETDSYIQVSVIDSGIGISSKDQAALFQKFSRAGSVVGAFDQEGVGLGLYISRLILEAHGGDISVDSVVGKGSAFHIVLPKVR